MSSATYSRFQLLRKLGEGGMGVVYEAYDRVREKRIALKRLRNDCADGLLRFKREFRALCDISHPNIITLYELLEEDGRFYLAMEIVDGVDFVTGLRGEKVAVRGAPVASRSTVLERVEDDTDTGPTSPLELPLRALPHGLPTPPAERRSLPDVVAIECLMSALRQLAEALQVLHAAGTFHRDLKPSNVMVERGGRVVLMDFGIVSETKPDGRRSEVGVAVGTPGFMAPEQARGEPATAATDWYAFGVMMYAALAGTLPFVGGETAVLQAKQKFAPLSPSEFARDIPDWLEQLCLELLSREPHDRPVGAQILARLGADAHELAPLSGTVRSTWSEEVFIGRQEQLHLLRSALAQAQLGESRCVLVRGPLGIGKSALLERFASELRTSERPPLVFSGRCHERESLHYKALDNIIDQLSCHLADLPSDRLDGILDAPPRALMQVFPVLRRVSRWSDAPAPSGSPHAVRQAALHSLRTILRRLAVECPVVLCIDDLQWAGGDSMELLLDVLWPPAPSGLLVVATLGMDAYWDESALGHYVASIEGLSATTRLSLGPLSMGEQRSLAEALVGQLGSGRKSLDEVHERAWIDAAGHPMLLVEIARHSALATSDHRESSAASLSLNLEDIIYERVVALSDNERLLMQLIAVAGEPMPMRLLARVGRLSLAEAERAAAFLRINHLARVSRSADEPWLDTYHDKVRRAIIDRLPDLRARGLHSELARALERWRNPRAALMGRQWLLAGNLERAARYLMSAATDAADSLAFEHAAKLYATAVQLRPELSEEPDPRCGFVAGEVLDERPAPGWPDQTWTGATADTDAGDGDEMDADTLPGDGLLVTTDLDRAGVQT